MERLAAKKGQGVLDVLRTSKDKGELKRAIQTWKDTDGQEGPAASETDILSKDESISFDEKRRKRAPKRAEFEPSNVASISDTGDLNAVDYLNPPETSGPSELKATTAEERADLEKKYGSWRAAKEAIKAEGDRYRAALQPKKGFEEQYDADVKFQEEEYGGGSLERDRLVAEIAGYDYVDKSGRQQRARGEDEDLYEKYYFKAQEDTPWAQKEALQDAALKGVREHRARKSELRIDKILRESDVEATEDVGARFEEEDTLAELEAEEAERLKKEKEKEKEKGKEKEREAVGRALDKGKFKAERIRTLPDGTPIEEATEEYIKSSYGPDRVASAAKLALMKQTADARERRLPEQPTDEVDEVVPSGASADLYSSLTSEQRLPMERQPQGVNLGAALDGLASKDLRAFNKTFGSTFTPGFGKTGPYAEHFRGLEEFVSKLSPELRDSVAKELKPLVVEKRKSVDAALTQNVRDTLFEKWGTEKGYLSEEDNTRLGRLAERISGILQEHVAPSSSAHGRGTSEDGRMAINQLLEDAGGDFLHPRALITGRKVRYMQPLDRKAPLAAAIDYELLRLPGWAGFVDTGRAERNLRMLGAASEGPPAVLEAGELSFEELLEKAKGIEAPGDSPVEDIIVSAVEGE